MRSCCLLLSGALTVLRAAEPVMTHLHPAGVQTGTAVEVKAAGKFDPWPCRVWADAPGIEFTPGKDAGSFTVQVAAGVKPGPHLVRAVNDEGASAPVMLVVAAEPQISEVEPNNSHRNAQAVPAVTAQCNGRLDKNGDIDSWQVELKRGQTLTARVESHVLASGVDAMLRLVDSLGTTVAFNHDHTSMDPFLVYTAPADGSFVVQIMGHKYPASSEIGFTGGADCIYRLHLSSGSVVRHTWPLALPQSQPAEAALTGWNLEQTTVTIDPAVPPAFPVLWSGIPELVEKPEAPPMPVPSAVSGRLETAGEEDRHTFQAVKGEPLQLAVMGPSCGSLIDPLLRLLDSSGQEIATQDDSGSSREPSLVWTPPADGVWTAAVRDLTRQSGPDYFYRLAITRPAASVEAVCGMHALKVEAGRTTEAKVTVTRVHGFAEKLKLAARDLPAGVTAAEVEVPDKNGEVSITLTAAPGAARCGLPFRLVLLEPGGREHPVIHQMISTSENNGVPQGYQQLLINGTPLLWLTVTPAPPAAK